MALKSKKGCLVVGGVASLMFVGVLYWLLIHLTYVGLKGPTTHELDLAVRYAVGMYSEDNVFGARLEETENERIRARLKLPKRCAEAYAKSCIRLMESDSYRQCAWWHLERCSVAQADAILLSRPDILGPFLRAFYEPCAVLPDYNYVLRYQWDNLPGYSATQGLKQLALEYGCDGSSPTGSAMWRRILNFVDENDEIVLTVERPALDR